MIQEKIGPYEVYRVIAAPAPGEDPEVAYEALQEGFIDRADDMDVSRITLDEVGGFTAGHSSKLLCVPPIKMLGQKSLGKMMKATGMALVMVIDDAKFAPLRATMTLRKRPMRRTVVSIANEIPREAEITVEMQRKWVSDHMSKLGKMGSKSGKAKGGKRRLKTMKKRARQEAATHAARMRWSKERIPA